MQQNQISIDPIYTNNHTKASWLETNVETKAITVRSIYKKQSPTKNSEYSILDYT